MRPRKAFSRTVTAALGLPQVAAVAAYRWRRPLRIVAYHRVPDAAAFDAQLRYLGQAYRPVDEAQVRAALAGGPPLPERAVWLTFDDGDPSVVQQGLPVLARHGLSATLYVCPGLVESASPPWWRVVRCADAAGVGAEVDGRYRRAKDLIRALERVPDQERRAVVEGLVPAATPFLTDHEAITVQELERWVDAGNTVGNHCWDHPCLNRCSPEEQEAQITSAHEWLLRFRPGVAPTFAYPNGVDSEHAERTLRALGYDMALMFDHALTDLRGDPMRLSRLRLDADAGLGRTRAVLSGAHSALLGLSGV